MTVRRPHRAARRLADRPSAGTRPAFLPSDVDPTVFDEAFLRQLERLLLLMRSPVRGGLKGGRRSVKRGQSVEFADYRDYTLGDDLRQLDWNVYARLEKLFVKLFVEEEDVTVTLLLDASASMATRQPEKLLFAKRAAAALGYIGLASRGPRRDQRPGWPVAPAPVPRCAAPAACSGCSPTCRRSSRRRPDRPRRGRPPRRRAAPRPRRRRPDLRPARPGADRVIRELAATGSELVVLHVLSPDELDPPLEGDLRLVDTETGDGIDITADLATLDAYRARLAAWKESFADLAAKRRAPATSTSRPTPLADLVFAELRRRRVLGWYAAMPFATRRSRCSGCCSCRPSSRCTCSSCGATRPSSRRRCCGSGWSPTSRRTRRGSGCAGACCCCSSCSSWPCSRSSPRGRSSSARPGLAGDIVLVVDTSASMAATDVPPDRLAAAKAAALDALRDLPAGGKVSVIAAGRTARIVANGATDLGRVRLAHRGISRRRAAAATSATRSSWPAKLAARSGDAEILVATDAALATAADGAVSPARSGPAGRPRAAATRRSSRWPSAPRPSAVTRSVFVSIANLDLEPASAAPRALGRRQPARGRATSTSTPQARADVSSTTSPRDVAVVEVRLVARRPDGHGRRRTSSRSTTAPGRSSRPTGPRLILLVGAGDPYLETALTYLPNVELFGVKPDEYGPDTDRKDGRPWDLVIFEGFLPADLPRRPDPRHRAAADAARSGDGRPGRSRNPGIGSLEPDEPILRYVDLSTTHIAEARKLVAARLGADGHPGSRRRSPPLRRLAGGPADRRPRLRAAPIGPAAPGRVPDPDREPDRRAAGRSSAPTEAVEPGTPVSLGHAGRRGRPVGDRGRTDRSSSSSLAPPAPRPSRSRAPIGPGSTSLRRGQHRPAPPRRRVVGADAQCPPDGATRRDRSSQPAGSPEPGASAAASPPPDDPLAPVRFAVDLFDVNESTIAPGSAAAIEALGVGASGLGRIRVSAAPAVAAGHHARRVVAADRPARARRPVRRVGPLPPRRDDPAAARSRGPVRSRGRPRTSG